MQGRDNSDNRANGTGVRPESANGHLPHPASGSSIDSQNYDEPPPQPPSRSDDLDKLSICLSEAASECEDGGQSSLFNELMQSQLAFWTLVISIFYTYAWQQHRKKFLFSLMMVVPPVVVFCCTLSMLLAIIVVMGWLFSTPMKFDDVLKSGDGTDEDGLNASASRTGLAGNRRRTMSGSKGKCGISFHSSHRIKQVGGRSSSCEDLTLPKPICRKHSVEHRGLGGGYGASEPPFVYKHDLVRAASNNTVISSNTAGSRSTLASSAANSNPSTPTNTAFPSTSAAVPLSLPKLQPSSSGSSGIPPTSALPVPEKKIASPKKTPKKLATPDRSRLQKTSEKKTPQKTATPEKTSQKTATPDKSGHSKAVPPDEDQKENDESLAPSNRSGPGPLKDQALRDYDDNQIVPDPPTAPTPFAPKNN